MSPSTGFDLTFPKILDMTLRYRRFRLLPEHPDLRPTLQTAVDALFIESVSPGEWWRRTRTHLLKSLIYQVMLRRLKVLQLSPDATLQLLRAEIHRSTEGGRQGGAAPGDRAQHRGISPDLVALLVCPVDQQPLTLVNDANQREWLLNPRNGYCYPVEEGIPILRKEEGKKYQNTVFIA